MNAALCSRLYYTSPRKRDEHTDLLLWYIQSLVVSVVVASVLDRAVGWKMNWSMKF